MDDSALQQAHSFASQADNAVLAGQPREAIALYKSAASNFERAFSLTNDPEGLKMLKILHNKYNTIAVQLQGSITLNPELFKPARTPTSTSIVVSNPANGSNLANTLASARGIPVDGHYVSVTKQSRRGVDESRTGGEDPFNKFSASLEASFNKIGQSSNKTSSLLDSLRRQHPGLFGIDGPNSHNNNNNTIESFYVVPGKFDTDVTENSNLLVDLLKQISVYENLIRRQRDVMRSNLGKLRQEVHSRETRTVREFESEIERLVAENDKLKIQNGRLRSRWEGLKESAKKRMTGTTVADTIAEEEEQNEGLQTK
ncbi:hypothetical protein V1514DRAFT_332306 [Lipomyces japonicus]|uniref:uncharacterized protein n=1 Tax=Lipomyces japonicus TaxID=56871 RepID=UPI0034D00E44